MAILRFMSMTRLMFLLVFLIVLVFNDLVDPDYWWHLATGEYILEHRSLPDGDVFSYTFEGRPWVLHEWLFQVVLALTHQLAGDFGVHALTAGLTVWALSIAHGAARHFLPDHRALLILLTLAVAALLVMAAHPRPQLFSYVFFSAYLDILLAYRYRGEVKGLWLLPPMMVLWVNLHGAYPVGMVLIGLFVLAEGEGGGIVRWRKPEGWRRMRTLLGVGLATLLASAVNPDHVLHWLYPFQIAGMKVAQSGLLEWESPDFHMAYAKLFLGLVLGYFVAGAYRWHRPDLADLVVPGFFAVMGFVAVRHMPLAVLALLPFLARTLADGPLDELRRGSGRLGAWWGLHVSGGTALGDREYVFNWILAVGVTLALLAVYPARQAGSAERLNESLPVKAADYILSAGVEGNMFNTYHYGGYLIHRLWPGRKVFIDGRADLYGDAFIREEYDVIHDGRPGWKSAMERHAIDYVVCEHNAPIRQLLLARGDFTLAHDDEKNSVLVRRLP